MSEDDGGERQGRFDEVQIALSSRGPGRRVAASALPLAPCMLRVAVESAMRARQTDCPMVQAPLRDRSIARVVAPLLPTEPEQLPGTPAKPTSPHRQGRATTNGGEQPDDANAHLLRGHRRGQEPLGRGAPAEREYMEATNDERGIR